MKEILKGFAFAMLIFVFGITISGCKKDETSVEQVKSMQIPISDLKGALAFQAKVNVEDIAYDEVKREFILLGDYFFSLEEVMQMHDENSKLKTKIK